MRLRSTLISALFFASAAGGGSGHFVPAALANTASVQLVFPANIVRSTPGRFWPRPPADQSLYVANNGNRTITVYAATANGNVAPTRRIGGSKTLIYGPIGGLAQDGAGNLYVGEHQNGILVFAPGATGDVAPIRRIYGPNTTLGNVQALAVDSAGTMFAGTEVFVNGRPSFARVLRFEAGANGNVAPAAALVPGQEIGAVALDSTGYNIIVTAPALQSVQASDTFTFPRAFTANSPALYDVAGYIGGAVVSDPGNASYFACALDDNEVIRFANAAQGLFGHVTPPPRQFLFVAPAGLALDAFRDLYASFGTTGTGIIKVYAGNASGHAGTLRTISGPSTLLSQPQSIYVGR